MIFVFIFIVYLGYLIYLKGGYDFNSTLKDEEKIYKIKDKDKDNLSEDDSIE